MSLVLSRDLGKTYLYHITDVSNLPSIIASGALLSDCALASVPHQVIGYGGIKQRRMTEYRIPCCANRFVGEFVPFYYCPRSPMLFTVNRGNTGLSPGCQTTIVHLRTTIEAAIRLNRQFAISDVNAGTGYATFRDDLAALDDGYLDWEAIKATQWKGRQHLKQAEFLVADHFEWAEVMDVACHNLNTAAQVNIMLGNSQTKPAVKVVPSWYY